MQMSTVQECKMRMLARLMLVLDVQIRTSVQVGKLDKRIQVRKVMMMVIELE